tara:strand:+ start:3261 stop:4565 length:1305 start_codon:yes stop_codon:yes gene_type:complete
MDLFLLKKYIEHSRNFYYQNPKNYNIILKNQIPEYNTEPIKKGKFIYITFADALRNQEGNNRIVNAKKLKIRINNNKLIDEFIVYNLKDVDANFKNKFLHLLTNKKYFAWICKVYFINKKLKELDENDVLLWTDSDIDNIYQNGTLQLFNLCNNSEKGIVGFHHNFWLEKYFTKKSVFEYLNVCHESYYETQQAYGGILLVKKNQFTINIIEQWLQFCLNPLLFSDNNNKYNQHKEFIEHKHCQSIFSLLLKKNNIKTFPLPLWNNISTTDDIIALNSGYKNHAKPIIWSKGWHRNIETIYKDCQGKLLWNAARGKHQRIMIPNNTLYISTKILKQTFFDQESSNQITTNPPPKNKKESTDENWESHIKLLAQKKREVAAHRKKLKLKKLQSKKQQQINQANNELQAVINSIPQKIINIWEPPKIINIWKNTQF